MTKLPRYYGLGSPRMSLERKRQIASQGGKAAHRLGTAHEWDSEEARRAGRLGGSRSKRGPAKQKVS